MPTNRKGYLKEFRERMREQGLCEVCCKPMDKPSGLCQECTDRRNAYFRTEQGREKRRIYRRDYRRRLRQTVLDGYGAVCVCCGEANPLFLTLDHTNSDGHLERNGRSIPSHKFLTKLIREEFPPHMQVMCFNCNLGRSRNGGVCPHKNV